MSIHQLEQEIPNIVSDYPSIDLVYLFGSRAAGNVSQTSDYDIGVLIGRGEMSRAADVDRICVQLAHDLSAVLCTDRIDVVVLNRAPIELQRAVTARGKLLHQRDVATRVEYEAHVMSVYGDYLPVLRAQREEILRGDERGIRVQRYRTALGRTRRALGKITSAQRDPR